MSVQDTLIKVISLNENATVVEFNNGMFAIKDSKDAKTYYDLKEGYHTSRKTYDVYFDDCLVEEKEMIKIVKRIIACTKNNEELKVKYIYHSFESFLEDREIESKKK